MHKKFLGMLLIVSLTFSLLFCATPVFALEIDPFTDVPSNHWAYQSVMNMARLGIISGYPDGTFKPDKYVSREEFAKILCGATSLPIATPRSNTFSDVTKEDWSFPYVETVKDYLTGYPSPSGSKPLFKGREDATREDVAVALVKIKGFDKTTLPNPNILEDMFKDTNTISSNLKNLVAIAVEKGLLSGYPDKTIRGSQTLTRAEAATFIDKANRIAGDVKDVSYYNSAELLYLSIDCDKNLGKPGERITATAQGVYTSGHKKDITSEVEWYSTNTSVASINDEGIISLKQEGNTTIIASKGDKTDSREIAVLQEDKGDSEEIQFIKITPETHELKAGEFLNLKAEAIYENGRVMDITKVSRWESSNINAAFISSDGKVAALNEGTVLIKAIYNDVTGYAGLTITQSVYSPPPSEDGISLSAITISHSFKELKKGNKVSITAIGIYSDQSKKDITQSVTWSSSNNKVCTITSKGEIIAHSEGVAIITATKDGKSNQMFIYVKKK